MPEGVMVSTILDCILGDASGIFFDLRHVDADRLALVVTRQCVSVLLKQLTESQWELTSDEAVSLGKQAWESIKRRRVEEDEAAI